MPNGSIFIPDKTPDLRTCLSRRWNNGVNVASSLARTYLASTCSDGADGSYVVAAESLGLNSWTVRLHHVDGAGLVTASTVLATAGGVWYFSAAVVPSANNTCIVTWTHPTYGAHLLAQRFDAQCTAQWSAPVQLIPSAGGFDSLGAAADGSGGALVACNRRSLATGGGTDYRVQRVDSSGALQWGNAGTQVTASGANGPHLSSALAVGTSAVGLAWTTFGGTAPNPVFGAWLDFGGQLTVAPFAIGSVLETWTDLATPRAIGDPGDGMYVAVSRYNVPLEVRRFEANQTQPRWTASGPTLTRADAYALSGDGSGGVLVATVDTGGVVALQRRNAQGASLWTSAAATAISTIATGQIPTQPGWRWSRLLTVRDRDSGGATVTFPTGTAVAPRLMAWCCDANGAGSSQPTVIGGGAGAQLFPLSHRSEQDSVNLVWEGQSGAQGGTIEAQKLGCCPPTFPSGRLVDRFPTFPCSIPFDMPTRFPGGFRVLLVCGSGGLRGGMLPLSSLHGSPGIHLPGALTVRGVPAPDWTRLTFSGVPVGVQVELRTHGNEMIATAEAVNHPEPMTSPLLSLTFKPSAKLSYVLVFAAKGKHKEPIDFELGMQVDFGRGKPAAFPDGPKPGKPRVNAKKASQAKKAKKAKKKSSKS